VLLSIGLTDLALKIGTDEFGVSITQGSVAIASLAPTAAGDTRRWLAVVADDVTASVNAGSLLSITVSALDVVISQQTPAGTPPLDWSAELSLDNDATFNEAADALTIANLAIDPAADTLLVSGDNATVSVADGFITGRADFTLGKAPVQFKANGTTIESGVLLSIGLTDLALKIGTDEFGVSITQGSVAIASLAPTAAGDTRRWLAVVANDVTASVNAGRCCRSRSARWMW
jgi:hypothetical protein